jgi:FkbM family methyltransferase
MLTSLTLRVRSLARRFGLIRVINRLRPIANYEDRFHQSLEDAIRPGDHVWDIGANVGLYTELFCQWVGPQGSVTAFEPSPESAESIRRRLPDCPWLEVENVAVGKNDEMGQLVLTGSSVTNHLAGTKGELDEDSCLVPVTICRGDSIRNRLGRVPNIVKIDVEGLEEDVLEGMERMLDEPALRGIFMEVHFHVLELRGERAAPIRIEKKLRARGFKTEWVGASHLRANRIKNPS